MIIDKCLNCYNNFECKIVKTPLANYCNPANLTKRTSGGGLIISTPGTPEEWQHLLKKFIKAHKQ